MTAVQTTWRGVAERYWPPVVALAVALVVNPVFGAVTAFVLALLRWRRDRPVALALVAVGIVALAYVAAFAAVRVR